MMANKSKFVKEKIHILIKLFYSEIKSLIKIYPYIKNIYNGK